MTEYINKENLIKAIEDKRPLNWNDTEAELAEQTAYDDIIDLIKDFNDDETSHINEFAEADKEGRCLVLPCKVRDTVFTYCYLRNSGTFELSEYKIYGIEIDDKTITYKATKWKPVGNGVLSQKVEWWFDIKDIGKDVFFTKEERKKALEGLRFFCGFHRL